MKDCVFVFIPSLKYLTKDLNIKFIKSIVIFLWLAMFKHIAGSDYKWHIDIYESSQDICHSCHINSDLHINFVMTKYQEYINLHTKHEEFG